MDREEAHKILGLYLGAPSAQVEAKYAELAAAEPAREPQFALARDTALGKPTQVIAAPTPLMRRGPVVLLMIAAALALCVGLFFAAAFYLDDAQAERKTREQHEIVKTAHDEWAAYRTSVGIGQTPDGGGADDLFAGAESLLESGDYENATLDYETALQLYNSAFRAEEARIGGDWQRDVLDFIKTRLAGKFPFDPESEVDAEADDLARLLNPSSGAIWSIQRERAALAMIELGGRNFRPDLHDPPAFLAAAAQLRDALFGAHSPTIDTKFQIHIESPKALAELRLEVGGVVCSTRKDGAQTARWTQANGGVKLVRMAWGNEVKEATIDKSSSDWGLLRVLTFGEPSRADDGTLVWEFSAETISGKKSRGRDATIHIRPEGKGNPFDPLMYEYLVSS